jgi:hypothetical protein
MLSPIKRGVGHPVKPFSQPKAGWDASTSRIPPVHRKERDERTVSLE